MCVCLPVCVCVCLYMCEQMYVLPSSVPQCVKDAPNMKVKEKKSPNWSCLGLFGKKERERKRERYNCGSVISLGNGPVAA